MVDLEKLKSVYKDKEPLDLELVKQLKLIRCILGAKFCYKDFEYDITYKEIIDIDSIQDVGDGIIDIFFVNGELEITLISLDEELLTMSEEELRTLKENK